MTASRARRPRATLASLVLSLVAGVCLVAAPTSAVASDTVLWNGDWETGGVPHGTECADTGLTDGPDATTDQYLRIEESEGCGEVSLASTPTRDSASKFSGRFHMAPGTQRSQAVAKHYWHPTSDGSTERWFGMSMYFAPDWDLTQLSTSKWCSVVSFRAADANGSMNVSCENGARLALRRNTLTSWPDGLGLDKMDLGPIERGRWIDFVFHIKFSTTSTGALREVYRDGTLMGQKTSMNSVSTNEHRFRVGVYQDTEITDDRTLYFDNVRIGSSRAAVEPSGSVSGGVVGSTDTTAPSLADGVSATTVGSTDLTLAWPPATDNVGVAGYHVWRDGLRIATVSTAGFKDVGLTAESTYRYAVSAYDAAGNTSALSPLTSVTSAAANLSQTTTVTTGSVTPAFVAATGGASNAAGATTYSFKLPSGLVDGDVLLASINTRGNPVLTPPAGWNRVTSADAVNVVHQVLYFHRCAASCSVGTTATWRLSTASGVSGVLAGYRGVSGVQPVDGLGSQVNDKSTKSPAPSVTTTSPRARVVSLYGTASGTTFTGDATTTTRASAADSAGTYRSTTGLADRGQSEAGATGVRTGSFRTSASNVTITVALRPI